MKGHFARVLIATLTLNLLRLKQPDEEHCKGLARSWLKHPVHPIVCRRDLTVADGNCRVIGLGLLGETEADVFITEQDLTDDDLTVLGFVTAHHRAPLDAVEQAHAVKKLKDSGLTNKAIAELLEIDLSEPTRLLSLFDCPPEVQAAARDGRLGKTDWYAISRSDDQTAQLRKKLNGATRDELEEERRRQRHSQRGGTPSARPKPFEIPVATAAATGTVALHLPEGTDLATVEAVLEVESLLKQAKVALGVRVRLTPPKGDNPGTVTVAREAADAQAQALIVEALKLAQNAKRREKPLNEALVEWQNIARAPQPEPDTQPQAGDAA